MLRWPEARVNIDPKADACVEPLVAVIDRLGAWERVGIGAFSDRRLRRIRGLSRGRACTSMGPRAVAAARAAALCGRMPREGADCVQIPLRSARTPIVTASFVRAAHRAGLPVHVWTVNAESTMHDLLDLGVDGIMTDRGCCATSSLRAAWPWPASEPRGRVLDATSRPPARASSCLRRVEQAAANAPTNDRA